MTNPERTNAKLIILYIVKECPGIPSGELTDRAVASLYMDYFAYIEAVEGLARDRLIQRSIRKGETVKDADGRPIERMDITPEGEQVLSFLLSKVPSGIRSYLSAETENARADIRKRNYVTADYAPDANGAFLVRLILSDGIRKTAEIELFAPSEDSAKDMCRRWKESTADIYERLIRSLSSDLQ
ncbi:MAG: DUF4364 family protein [Clostridiaceae bacterium]|nr:DUF4364 family protein [Clostridiaceae bacterium]